MFSALSDGNRPPKRDDSDAARITMKKQVEYLQRLFYDIWNDFGSVFLLVRYSDNTLIGRRGFTEDEKKKGLVLVFNNKTSNQLEWDAEGNVSCILAFGTSKENVSIHHDDLLGLFSPDAGIQFLRTDAGEIEPVPGTEPEAKQDNDGGGSRQVVSLKDFKKRKTTGTN